MPLVKVSDVCEQIRGVSYSGDDAMAVPESGYLAVLRANNITDEGLSFDDLTYVPEARISAKQLVIAGDVVIAASSGSLSVVGKAAPAMQNLNMGFGAFCKVLRPNSKVDHAYFAHFFKTRSYRQKVSSLAAGANINNLRNEHLDDLPFPLPPLEDQRRIAAILDQAETIRTQRRTALSLLDSLTQSLFLDMFGDPVANPKGWPTESLTDLCHCYSGGTPSKAKREYWEGELPWFSAKDMKAEDLFDSEDHISGQVPETTTLKLLPKDTVAIVVRGMILAHTFPVCVLRIPATINQDLKALLPKQPVNSQFLAACLRSQSGFVLEKVSEAGHGTKRLDTQGLQSIRIPRPGDALEQTFATRIASIEALKATHRRALAALDALFASLQQRAFSGELTLAAPRSPAQSLEHLQQLEASIGLEALIFIAKRMPDGDLYNSLKAIYFADRHHLEHHGRQIYNETYCALPHGPVPQSAYDATRVLIGERMFSDFDDDAMRAALRRNDKKLTVLRDADFSKLSRSVVESLEWAIRYCSDMKFGQTKTASHDSAYERAPKNEAIPLQYIIDTLPPEARQRHWDL
ncbi:restriction endonuclease subunit S [Acidovorax sp.]|uniref:restriction endonuclease subunit S n=1 Tax=Acidovorax sp. TaxID=1872122 RepID=UPI0025B8AD94|nr:restriction endonuclease subunit S [Acidovorax sp.]